MGPNYSNLSVFKEALCTKTNRVFFTYILILVQKVGLTHSQFIAADLKWQLISSLFPHKKSENWKIRPHRSGAMPSVHDWNSLTLHHCTAQVLGYIIRHQTTAWTFHPIILYPKKRREYIHPTSLYTRTLSKIINHTIEKHALFLKKQRCFIHSCFSPFFCTFLVKGR